MSSAEVHVCRVELVGIEITMPGCLSSEIIPFEHDTVLTQH